MLRIQKNDFEHTRCSFLLCPITCAPLKKYFSIEYSKSTFSIVATEAQVSELEDRYAKIISKVKYDIHPDFVIFPEML